MQTTTENPIARERKARGLTQVDLAIRTKRSPTTISLAERGLVSEKTLADIAAALGVAASELRQ
jgi:transcriptional regulator with XRE-family HTH domain